MKKIEQWVWHPLAFAAFPVISLWADNIVEITFGEVVRSLLASLAAAGLIFLLLWLLFKRADRAGLAASFIVIMFFSFGGAYNRWSAALPQGSLLGQANVLAALWAAVLIVGTWALLRLLRNPAPLSTIANVVAAAGLVFALYPVGAFFAKSALEKPVTLLHPADLDPQAAGSQNGAKPDIYYIILDGYGRTDALKEIHQVDNSEFLAYLEQRGFVVAAQSTTNYGRTMHSLSSSLNFHYLSELMDAPVGANNYSGFRKLIADNAVMRFLKTQSYRTVALATGFEITEVDGADVFLGGGARLSYFEETLLSHSLAIFWVDQVVGDFRRDEITQAFAALESAPGIKGPKFVFAHLVVPHPPFVFDENGGPVAPRGWGDGTTYAGGVDNYLESYRRQLLYVNKQVEHLVRTLQEQSTTPPVIIIQGDHGPGALVDWYAPQNTCLRERMPILNAYALPGVDAASISQDITPVNTFRLVLNHYFGAQLAFEPNRNYMVTIPRPYQYIDVTAKLGQCPFLQK